MTGDPGFLGTGWAFPPAFDGRTQGAVMVDGAADVRESLRILLSTAPGERIMHPTYGCGLRRMVFEQINTSAITEIRSMIEKAVLFFEPRVTLEHTRIETDALDEGLLRIRLDYCIRSTNSRDNLVFPLYLQPGELPRLIEEPTS
ncbi:GPW/gp25 family protein [Roseateles amylovorans]|uniref:GPW/gp25 family protein n=1 Tax=Roseateles amylovorans TaxID=2978473 RepID=A0ABY6B3W3_9BURK|nr:GPW/gp25 family protein [Roseateles amylovorans]UXH79420.1 GPW/gp25 family protein [Roseateles amylovorans]